MPILISPELSAAGIYPHKECFPGTVLLYKGEIAGAHLFLKIELFVDILDLPSRIAGMGYLGIKVEEEEKLGAGKALVEASGEILWTVEPLVDQGREDIAVRYDQFPPS